MSKLTREWFECSDGVLKDHSDIEIKQRYCFIFTKDNKVIIVSKDNKQWQFPGGHPRDNESWQTTLQREVWEETGIDINNEIDNIIKLGYYIITSHSQIFIQERYLLLLDGKSDLLTLKPNEDACNDTDIVKFVKAIKVNQISQYIPWAPDAEGWKLAINYFNSNT